ncbi:MAG TPA: acyl transferase, partial [Flavobacteriaceae bacterium]|nr:acyl transferase [Flavobacteriaceae bacterium]
MLSDTIFNITTFDAFEETALKVFAFQFENNPVYRSFCDLLYKHPSDVKQLEDIPFLPISFFKTHKITTETSNAEIIFTSSGTTSSATSKHHVADLNIYKKSYLKAFEHFYGNIEDYIILGLLPSYLERDGSSLIYMVNDLIEKSNDSRSGFYLNQLDELTELLIALDTTTSKKILLIGVSFA